MYLLLIYEKFMFFPWISFVPKLIVPGVCCRRCKLLQYGIIIQFICALPAVLLKLKLSFNPCFNPYSHTHIAVVSFCVQFVSVAHIVCLLLPFHCRRYKMTWCLLLALLLLHENFIISIIFLQHHHQQHPHHPPNIKAQYFFFFIF